MAADSRPGPRPVWNYVGVAFALGVLVILFAPAAPEYREENQPTTSRPTGQTITLAELEAMLTDHPAEPPASFELETPDGPVTVIVPTTTTTTSTTTTSTTTTSTIVPRPPRPTLPPVDEDSIIDQLLGQSIPTTIPEGDGGER